MYIIQYCTVDDENMYEYRIRKYCMPFKYFLNMENLLTE